MKAETVTLKLDRVDAELVRQAKYAALDRRLTLKQFVLDSIRAALGASRAGDGAKRNRRSEGE